MSRHRRPARGRMRHWLLGSLALVTAVIVAYAGYSVAAPVPAAEAQEAVQTVSGASAQIVWPKHGVAALGVIGQSGLLASHGSTTSSIPTASMAKTVTALVLMTKKPLTSATDPGPTIRFTAKDKQIQKQVMAEGGSWATVTPGVPMSERQAVEAMLLPSANNYAISLADWAFGSVGSFTRTANSWLTAHHLTGTHMADPDGLSASTRSTPADLVEIARLVRANSALSSIVDTTKATIPGAGVQWNTNTLLGTDGINGVKTGNTTQAGYCLMFSFTLTLGGQSRTVVGVVAGDTSFKTLFADVTSLVKSVRSGFHDLSLTKPGMTFGTYSTPWGQDSALVSPKASSAVTWSNTVVSIHVAARPVTSGAAGTQVGTVTFTEGDTTIATQPLELATTISPPSLAWLMAHPPRGR